MTVATVSVPLPANSTIRVNGFTNSGTWGQQIVITTPDEHSVTWTGDGNQSNKIVGQEIIAPLAAQGLNLKVAMSYNDGNGWRPSSIVVDAFNLAGFSGYTIGGQDSGGRPSGPAYWNTVVFIYWADGY